MFDFTNEEDIGNGCMRYDVSFPEKAVLGQLSDILSYARPYYETGHIYISNGFAQDHEPCIGAMIAYARGYKIRIPEWLAGIEPMRVMAICHASIVDYYISVHESIALPMDAETADMLEKRKKKPVLIKPPKKYLGDPLTEGRYMYYSCPSCGKMLGSGFWYPPMTFGEFKHFCEECGQALDWKNMDYRADECMPGF